MLVVSDYGHPTWVPLALFSITDNRASRYWIAIPTEKGGLELSHPSFEPASFFDDLSEGRAEAKASFEFALRQLEAEFLQANASIQ